MDKPLFDSDVDPKRIKNVADGLRRQGEFESARMLDGYADLLEAREKAVPVAYAAGLEANMRGFLDVMAWSEGEFTIPLYTHPAPSDAERLAEALRQAAQSLRTIERGAMREEGLEDAENVRAYAHNRADVAGNALAAHSAQAQPPAASVTDTLAVFEVVSGVEGPCLTISRKADGKPRHEYRLAGPKPWGGGNTTHSFKVHTRELREQIDAIEAALAAAPQQAAEPVAWENPAPHAAAPCTPSIGATYYVRHPDDSYSVADPQPAQDAKGCVWSEDEEGNWDTGCGNMFVITEGTPYDNEMGFCCYCGGKLDQVTQADAAMAKESGR